MKKIIAVAGATGNLGGNIIHALLEKGAVVHAIVRASSDNKKIDEQVLHLSSALRDSGEFKALY